MKLVIRGHWATLVRRLAESDMVAERKGYAGVQRSNERPDARDSSSFVNCKRVRETVTPNPPHMGLTSLSIRVFAEIARSDDDRRQIKLKSQINQALEFHRARFSEDMESLFQVLLSERLIRSPGYYTVNEFPILLTNAMGVQQALPFYLCVVYEFKFPVDWCP